jgi:Bardet-Biedl syndrome 2 protein
LDARNPDVDLLFVGSSTNLLVYDCIKNADVFDQEIDDGVSVLDMCEAGSNPDVDEPMVIVGGNNSITGIDITGDERFWTIASGNVTAIQFMDVDGDGDDEMITCSDDSAVRILKGEDAVFELAEKAPVVLLTKVTDTTYGYCLKNGSFGVYEKEQKLWRQPRSNHDVAAICGCSTDVFGDGRGLLVVGFSSGVIQVHRGSDGEMINRIDTIKEPIAQLLFDDFRMMGKKQVIAVTTRGKVFGFNVQKSLKQLDIADDAESKAASEKMLALSRKKLELQNKMEQL